MSVSRGTNLLSRMEAAHRQTKAHLERIERQISARAERMTTSAKAKARSHPRGGSRWTRSDEALFRAYVDQISFERRGEIDALTRKLSRQEIAIDTVRAKRTSHGSRAGEQTRSRHADGRGVSAGPGHSLHIECRWNATPAGLPSVLVAVVNRRPEPSRPLTRRGAVARTILAKPVPRNCARA